MTTKYKLLYRTKWDGYLYLGSDFKIYFCDHSGDNKNGDPTGPDRCEDSPSPIDMTSTENPHIRPNVYLEASDVHSDIYTLKREDGKSVMLTARVYNKLKEIAQSLNIKNFSWPADND